MKAEKIRICTWNLWHGLNPYGQPLMLPLESPWASLRRRELQLRELEALKAPRALEFFCFQEVNPFPRRMNVLKRRLQLEGAGCLVNAGLKVGWTGVPPFLKEGIAILHSNSLQDVRSGELVLSGEGFEWHGPFGSLLNIQWKEKRKAFLLQGTTGTLKIGVVNLHLHHGPDTVPANFKRKKAEIKTLVKWLKPQLADLDLAAIVGDFNCDPDSEVVEPLAELGFDWESVGPTWDPENNRMISSDSPDRKVRDWDSSPHEFDRIYLRKSGKKRIRRVRRTRVLESGLSDHFGVLAEIDL
jgi:endonuclease/exonuclease/phosphatase family metal-dependent hydrolase